MVAGGPEPRALAGGGAGADARDAQQDRARAAERLRLRGGGVLPDVEGGARLVARLKC